MSSSLASRTYLPSSGQALADIRTALATDSGAADCSLRGPKGDVPIPSEIYEILHQVVASLSTGQAITITPNDPVVTTQQAADLLGITRPTFVRLLDEGKIPFERISTRRKVRLEDVLNYREQRKQEQYRLLSQIAAPFDDEDDLDAMLSQSRAARKTVAARRRQARED